MNQLVLVASIAERDAMRYTPAGIPIVHARLQHQSEQVEANIKRQVEFEIAAIAAGEISGQFKEAMLLDHSLFEFTGFLARKSRNSKGLVFHIVDFKPIIYSGATHAQI